MEFGVGREEEIEYISHLVQKHGNRIIDEQFKNDNNILDIREYNYLQYLVFKYCFITNAALYSS